MKPEIALVFWGSGILLEMTQGGNIRVTPRQYKRGKMPVSDLEWLKANKAHVIARLRQEGDWRQLGLDRQERETAAQGELYKPGQLMA